MGNKPRRENYFQRNIAQGGKDFLTLMPPDRIRLDAIRIFKEISKGMIDMREYAGYFANPKLMDQLIVAAQAKFNFHQVSMYGCAELIKSPNPMIKSYDIDSVYDFHIQATSAYNIIICGLLGFRDTGNDLILLGMAQNLSRYKNYIN